MSAPTIAELDAFLATHPVDIVGPTHGALTMDPDVILALFKDGLRQIRGGARGQS